MAVLVPMMGACTPLYEGHNQVVYLGVTTTVSEAISSISEYVTAVYWWNGTQWVELSGSDTMEHGIAYDIEVTQDCDWCVIPPEGGGAVIIPTSMMVAMIAIVLFGILAAFAKPLMKKIKG